MHQVYNNTERLNHIFDLMGPIAPDGNMLLEHLGNERYPHAAANVRRICQGAGIEIH